MIPETILSRNTPSNNPLLQGSAISGGADVLISPAAVVAEIEGLTRQLQPSASWAKTALGQLGWLGKPVVMDSPDFTADELRSGQ
jgi:hypothetical protein